MKRRLLEFLCVTSIESTNPNILTNATNTNISSSATISKQSDMIEAAKVSTVGNPIVNKSGSKIVVTGSSSSYAKYVVSLNPSQTYKLSGTSNGYGWISVESESDVLYDGEDESFSITIENKTSIIVICYGSTEGAVYDFSILSENDDKENDDKENPSEKPDDTGNGSSDIGADIKIGYKKYQSDEKVNSSAIVVNTESQIKTAISNAKAGDIIYVRGGNYSLSSISISCAGTANNYITIKNYPNETPNLVSTKIEFTESCKYVNFEGFIIRDLLNLDWDYAVKFSGGSSYITFKNNEITNIRAKSSDNGCNPLVIYGDTSKSINNITVQNNYIYNCSTGWSEALTAEGNVEKCFILENTIDNTGNIGIDLAGNYSWTGKVGDTNNQARFITVSRNLVKNSQSSYATSAGIYCDGSRDNTISYNIIYNAQCGIELGAEEKGAVVENFYVHDNLIIDSGRSIGVGGYKSTSATHRNSYIYNNTIIAGDSNEENYGLMIERTSNLNFANNIIYATSKTTLLSNDNNCSLNSSNNCWYKSNGSLPSGESNSIFKDPLFIKNTGNLDGNYALKASSPCINAGKSVEIGDIDLAGNKRINGIIDIGAFEYYGEKPDDNPEEKPDQNKLEISNFKEEYIVSWNLTGDTKNLKQTMVVTDEKGKSKSYSIDKIEKDKYTVSLKDILKKGKYTIKIVSSNSSYTVESKNIKVTIK